MSRGHSQRQTKETAITVDIDLKGNGQHEIQTGIGFFDHMLTAFAVHSGFDLKVQCQGDLEVDGHHTVEDVGIALGQALAQATANKIGLARYGHSLIPMDEALARAIVDISGRPYLVFQGEFKPMLVGQYDPYLTEEFFRALAYHAGITLHITLLYGENDHHKIEAIYKAVAHALKQAVCQGQGQILSTKGTL